jgi:perosamine synthetase
MKTKASDTLALLGGNPAVTETIPSWPPVSMREVRAVTRSLLNTPMTTLYGGYDVERFERAFAQKFGFGHCVAMNSGTSSLHAAIVASGVGVGDEVIVPTYSFVATVSIVVQQGAVPVFCDISPQTLGIDVQECLAKVTPSTKAIVVVHMYGMPIAIRQLAAFCRKRKIALIEDCACGIGSTIDGRFVGGFGTVGCFSFNIGKLLRTGEGGMAVTNSKPQASVLRELRVNGLKLSRGINEVNRLGFNYTMPQMLGALGVVQLEAFDQNIRKRRKNAERLMQGMTGLPVKCLIPERGIGRVDYMTPIILDVEYAHLRDSIVAAARAERIPLATGYGEPLYKIPYLSKYAVGHEYPVSESLTKRLLVLDPAPFLSSAIISQIVEGLKKIFRNLDLLQRTTIT